ncbi:MAG: DsrE/DsrF/DrsH-like family protein [Hyphomicrobiaceae bacterium]
MKRRLVIVLVNTDPRNPEELGAPFYHASAAAALEFDVDVVCTATAGRLLRKGVAEKLYVKAGSDMTVYDWIRQAHENGAKFWACPANLELFDMTVDDLIPECSGMMGAVALMGKIMADDTQVLSY